MAVSLEPVFTAGRPQDLFETELSGRGSSGLAGFEVAQDGQRFVMVRQHSKTEGSEINVVLDWWDELRTLAPKGPK